MSVSSHQERTAQINPSVLIMTGNLYFKRIKLKEKTCGKNPSEDRISSGGLDLRNDVK